ncbi:MAG: hypothetical protein WAJ93_09755 [Candidatus Nitrosopolaris sp.]
MYSEDGPRRHVSGRWKSQGLWNRQPSHCGWLYHATCDDWQYHGAIRHHWRARRRNSTASAQGVRTAGSVSSWLSILSLEVTSEEVDDGKILDDASENNKVKTNRFKIPIDFTPVNAII